jgi:hypothetical protein
VKTARTILNSEPKSIIVDNEEGKCQRVDIEVLGRRILMKKETEKTLIYKYFTIEVQCICKMKSDTVDVRESRNHPKNVSRCDVTGLPLDSLSSYL